MKSNHSQSTPTFYASVVEHVAGPPCICFKYCFYDVLKEATNPKVLHLQAADL